MKNIKLLILSLLSIGLLFASCKKEETFKMGGAENSNPYGVYFKPIDTQIYNLGDNDPNELVFKVVRLYKTDKITVPITVEPMNEDSKGKFVGGEAVFEAGEDTADFVLKFPDIEEGKTYSVVLSCNDAKYVHIYGEKHPALSVKVQRVKWLKLADKASISSPWFWGNNERFECDVEQNETFPNKYRLVDPFKAMVEKFKPELDGQPDKYLEFEVMSDGLVVSEAFNTAIVHSNYKKNMIMIHPKYYDGGRPKEQWINSKVLVKNDKGEPLVLQIAPYVFLPTLGAFNSWQAPNGVIDIRLNGFVPVDYTINMEQMAYPQTGKLPVRFVLGSDVAKIRYAFVEGKVGPVVIETKASEMLDNTEAVELKESKDVELTFPKTGTYTIIAVSYDKDGKLQLFSDLVVNYLADGEDKAIVANVGAIVSDKLSADPKTTSKNSVECFINGKEITAVHDVVCKKADYELDEKKAEIMNTLSQNAVSEENLKLINGNGFTWVEKELEADTEYLLLVSLTNGFKEELIEKPFKTEK